MGANWLSTMITPSSPAITVTLPPAPSSIQVRWPRSVALTWTSAKLACGAGAGWGAWAAAPVAIASASIAPHPDKKLLGKKLFRRIAIPFAVTGLHASIPPDIEAIPEGEDWDDCFFDGARRSRADLWR